MLLLEFRMQPCVFAVDRSKMINKGGLTRKVNPSEVSERQGICRSGQTGHRNVSIQRRQLYVSSRDKSSSKKVDPHQMRQSDIVWQGEK